MVAFADLHLEGLHLRTSFEIWNAYECFRSCCFTGLRRIPRAATPFQCVTPPFAGKDTTGILDGHEQQLAAPRTPAPSPSAPC